MGDRIHGRCSPNPGPESLEALSWEAARRDQRGYLLGWCAPAKQRGRANFQSIYSVKRALYLIGAAPAVRRWGQARKLAPVRIREDAAAVIGGPRTSSDLNRFGGPKWPRKLFLVSLASAPRELLPRPRAGEHVRAERTRGVGQQQARAHSCFPYLPEDKKPGT